MFEHLIKCEAIMLCMNVFYIQSYKISLDDTGCLSTTKVWRNYYSKTTEEQFGWSVTTQISLGHRGNRRRPGAPITSPSLPGSPKGAAVAMVIMSPLSELTDTDGFEMHSASQRAPALPAPPPPIPWSVRPLCAGCWVTPE